MEQIEQVTTDILPEDEPGPPVSEHVRSTRAALDMTQRRLAELLGVTLRTVNRWEAGDSRPHRLYIERMDAMLLERQVLRKEPSHG